MTDLQLEGITLAQRLTQGPLEPAKALNILEQLLAGLEASHELGLVHGSISPQKIILTPGGKAVLMGYPGRDPGAQPMARFAHGAAEPGYAAPEQIADDPVGRRTDLYSLGVVAYAMLTGKDPFGASEGVAADDVYYRILYKPSPQVPMAALAGLPASVGPAIDRAMAKEPQGRFTDAKSFLESLRADSAVVPPAPPPDPKQVKREAEQQRREEEQRRREEEKKKRNAEKVAALSLAAEKRGDKDFEKQELAASKQEEKERKQREKAAAAWDGRSAASKGGGWSRKTLALAAGVIVLLLVIGLGVAYAMGGIGGSTETTMAANVTSTTQVAVVDDSTTTTEPVTTTAPETTTTSVATTTTTLPPSSTTLSTVSSTTTTKRTTTTVKPTTTTAKPTTTTVKPTTTTTVPPTTTTTAIVKQKATITVVQRVFTYDGAPHHLIITAEGGGEDLTSLVNPGASETEIGDYTVTWSFAGNAYYESDSRAAILTIQ